MLKTLSSGLEVLKMFTFDKTSWGGRELAAEINENHSKVYRILETLTNHNFLIKDPKTKEYSLGFSVWELGEVFSDSLQIKELIHPVLEELNTYSNESVFLTILDGEEALTFDAVEAKTRIRYSVSIGSRTPLYTGASYRSILAYMPLEFIDDYLDRVKFTRYTKNTMMDSISIKKDLSLIRSKGYAISRGEYTEDVIAVAVPIFKGKSVIGSITVSGPSYRINDQQTELFVKNLLKSREKLHGIIEKYDFHFGSS